VDPEVRVEQIATGLGFTEGPVRDHGTERLLFVDIRASAVYEWRAGAGQASRTAIRSTGTAA
jgi:sugar lactone lactonase YvrE